MLHQRLHPIWLFGMFIFMAMIVSGCGAQTPTATDPVAPQATAAATVALPTATPLPADTATPVVVAAAPTAPSPDAAACLATAAQAMLLALPGDRLALFDPAAGESCALPVTGWLPGMATMAQGNVFFAARTGGVDGTTSAIQRFLPDGTVEQLPYTVVDAAAGGELVAFVVAPDAQRIAWSVLGPSAGSDYPATKLLIADLATGAVTAEVAPAADPAPRTLLPIRFSADGSVLYYALQPYGIGGMWSSYVGRYDNLYAMASDGSDTPALVFGCGELGLGLCLGDFYVYDNIVTTLAYVDRAAGSVVVRNNEGTVLNTLVAVEEYVGYPTWGPGGELLFYTADLSDDPASSVAPALGLIQRVAPPTAPAETLASDAALLLPSYFINASQLVVGWLDAPGNLGLAVVGMDGSVQPLAVPAGATVLSGPAVALLARIPGVAFE